MRVLMQNRADAFKHIGGDTVQMQKTKEQLERLGVNVDISLELEPNLDSYDIVHLFNVTRIHETWLQYRNAKRKGKKVVLSSIYLRKEDINIYEEKALKGKAGIIKKIMPTNNLLQLVKTLFYTIQSKSSIKGFLFQLINGFEKQQLDVIKNVDIILPNSKMEMQAIIEDFNIKDNTKFKVVPNGIEYNQNILEINKRSFIDKYTFENFIFCPGRIEPLKNQLGIIKAMIASNRTVVFAGAINEKHKEYVEEFKRLVNEHKNIHYIGLLDREMLYSAYDAAKVVVLASWFETTGLVGLEGAIKECNLVITNKGYTKEYYKNMVEYCNPEDINSIRNAIEKSYNTQYNGKLKEIALNEYTWNKAALATLEGYKMIQDKI